MKQTEKTPMQKVTLMLPVAIVDEAREMVPVKGLSKYVTELMKEASRKRNIEGLIAMMGKVDIDDNLEELKQLELKKLADLGQI